MEFIKGQVFNITRLSEHIKTTKENKELKLKKQEELSFFNSVKEEIRALNLTLDQIDDKEAIESSIYRLKAAELDLNRQLRHVKNMQN